MTGHCLTQYRAIAGLALSPILLSVSPHIPTILTMTFYDIYDVQMWESEQGKSQFDKKQREEEERKRRVRDSSAWTREGANKFDLIEMDELLGEVDVGF